MREYLNQLGHFGWKHMGGKVRTQKIKDGNPKTTPATQKCYKVSGAVLKVTFLMYEFAAR